MQYNQLQIEIQQTAVFAKWFDSLRDAAVKVRIAVRIRRLSLGYLGDTKFVGDGVMELRLHFGPGYRLYFVQQGPSLILLLAGGTKGSQQSDIQQAKQMASAL